MKGEGLPVLIPAKAGEEDGVANFEREVEKSTSTRKVSIGTKRVRVILRQDLGRARDHLTEGDLDLFIAAANLKDGLNANDRELRRKGFERLSIVDPEQFPQEHLDHYAELPGLAAIHLPWIITERIHAAQIVLWYFKAAGRFSPAIFCPDMKTAMFVHMFLGNCGVCPECEKPFIAKKIGQLYCTLQHQNSYRNRRWRSRQEAKERKRRKTA